MTTKDFNLKFLLIKSKKFITTGNPRSVLIKKNVLLTFFLKGGTILIGLFLIPITLDYISAEEFGIWLTVSSLLTWINVFDIGIGNGLRNKIAGASSADERESIKGYVSTTYFIMVVIALLVFIILFFLRYLLNWNSFFRLATNNNTISNVIVIVLAMASLQFVVQLINTILTAIHKPFKSSFIQFCGQLVILLIIYILATYTQGNLITLVWVFGGVPIVITFIFSLYLYNTSLKQFAPSFKNIELKKVKGLFSIGMAFFVIQIAALIFFQTDNILITKIIGTKAVTQFNIAYKLFSVILIIFTVIITPYWSAFTDAYAKEDFEWIKSNLKKIRIVFLVLSIISIIVFFCSGFFYHLWIGKKILIPRLLSLSIMIYVIVCMWQTLHVILLNGIGKLRLQLVVVIIFSIINVPLAYLLGHYYGSAGVVSANTVVFVIMGILFTIQCNKILSKKATGIWNK